MDYPLPYKDLYLCVYHTNVNVNVWMYGLPSDLQVLTHMGWIALYHTEINTQGVWVTLYLTEINPQVYGLHSATEV